MSRKHLRDFPNHKPLWLKIVATVVVLVLLYVGSFGPVCWMYRTSKSAMTYELIADLYRPLIRAANLAPNPIRDAVGRFSGAGIFGYPTMLDCLTALLDRKLMWL